MNSSNTTDIRLLGTNTLENGLADTSNVVENSALDNVVSESALDNVVSESALDSVVDVPIADKRSFSTWWLVGGICFVVTVLIAWLVYKYIKNKDVPTSDGAPPPRFKIPSIDRIFTRSPPSPPSVPPSVPPLAPTPVPPPVPRPVAPTPIPAPVTRPVAPTPVPAPPKAPRTPIGDRITNALKPITKPPLFGAAGRVVGRLTGGRLGGGGKKPSDKPSDNPADKPAPKPADKPAPKPASPPPVRRPSMNKRTYVGLFVHTWHDTEKARRVMGEGPFVPSVWHWWGRPAFANGDIRKFTWTNREMIDYHVDKFIELDVDFIYLDYTNGTQPNIMAGAHHLCKRLQERRDGPRVVFWIEKVSDAKQFYREFYNKYDADMFFRWEGKPLLLIRGDGWTSAAPKPLPTGGVLNKFTTRWCWGLLGPTSGSMWTFKETSPPKPYVHNGRAEQIGMAWASQATYMTDKQGRKCRDKGNFFKSQIKNVQAHRPKIVTLCSFNEMMAINMGTEKDPKFTDMFFADCSADIIPMKGGHGDKYFKQAKAFIKTLR